MPFFNRRNTSRRWLQNLPTLPSITPITRPVPQIVYNPSAPNPDNPYTPSSPGVYEPEFTPYDTYQSGARSTTVVTRVTTDKNKVPEIRAEQPIVFKGFDVPIELRAGEPIAIDLYNYIDVEFPSRFYLTMNPDWLSLNESVLAGNAPEDITINETVKIVVLVETPNQSATVEFDITLIGSTIIDDMLTRLLDDQGTGLVAEDGGLAPLEANFIDLPTEVITHDGDIAVGVRFSDVVDGFTEATSAVLINNDGTDIHRNEAISGSGNDYVVVFDLPNGINDVYFIRIPKLLLTRGDDQVPQLNIDSPVFEVDNTGDTDRVSLIPPDLEIEQEFFKPETFTAVAELSRIPGIGSAEPLFSRIDQQVVCVGQPFILNLNSYLDVENATIRLKNEVGNDMPPGFTLLDGMVFGTVMTLEAYKYTPTFVAENDDGEDEVEVEMAMIETGRYTPETYVHIPNDVPALSFPGIVSNPTGIWMTACDQIFITIEFDYEFVPNETSFADIEIKPPNNYSLGDGYGTVGFRGLINQNQVLQGNAETLNNPAAILSSNSSIFVNLRRSPIDGDIENQITSFREITVQFQGFFSP